MNLNIPPRTPSPTASGWLVAGLVALLTITCQQTPQHGDPVLARVGTREISRDQFIQRAEWSLPPRDPDRTNSRRHQLLERFVLEKQLAQEGERMGIHRHHHLQELFKFSEDLALARALYQVEIRDKLSISETQIEQALEWTQHPRTIAYVLADESEEAETLHNLWLSGASLKQVIRQVHPGIRDSLSGYRKMVWGESEPAVEKAVFTLPPGQLSGVIPVRQGYIILRVDTVHHQPILSESDLQNNRRWIKKILMRRAERDASARFVNQTMTSFNVRFNDARVQHVIDYWVREATKEVSGEYIEPRPLGEDITETTLVSMQNLLQEPFVRFNGGHWTLEDMLTKWRAFHLPVDVNSPDRARTSMARNWSLIVRDALLARKARERGLCDEQTVKADCELWQDYYLGVAVLDSLQSGGEVNWHNRLNETFPVRIDSNVLETIRLSSIPALAIRPGQYAARVMPPWLSGVE